MPATRTASDLQRNISEIYELCEKSQEPVFITRNGSPDLVIMSVETYERNTAFRQQVLEYEQDLRRRLMKAYEEAEAGGWVPWEEVRRERQMAYES